MVIYYIFTLLHYYYITIFIFVVLDVLFWDVLSMFYMRELKLGGYPY